MRGKINLVGSRVLASRGILRPLCRGWPSRLILGVAALLLAAAPSMAAPLLTTVATFNGDNGANPFAGPVIDAAGNLYGTTLYGGANNYGTVFQVAAGTRAVSTLATFNLTNGSNPGVLIADGAGNLYGTSNGGPNNYGTVYQIAAGTHAPSMLASFDYFNNGGYPDALTMDRAGNFYGTTASGTGTTDGTVFRIAAGTHVQSTVVTFNGLNGAFPVGGLVTDSAGNLYGTTVNGNNLYKIAAGTNTITTLATFTGANGRKPQGLIADSAGNLYGTTQIGGANSSGTVFKFSISTQTLTTLASLPSGATPNNLLIDGAGNLFGLSQFGGANSIGMAFEVAAGAKTVTTLATFTSANAQPIGLTADAAGNLYGTTEYGGPTNNGTVFELTGTGFVAFPPAVSGGVVPLPSGAWPCLIATAGLACLGVRRRLANGEGLQGPLGAARL